MAKSPLELSETFAPTPKKTFKSLLGRRVNAQQDPYFQFHKFTSVPIQTLINDNNLNDPKTLVGKEDVWGNDPTKYKYDPQKDTDITNYIHATLNDQGKYILNGGRHRTRALANDGYTHVNIPVYDEYTNSKTRSLINELKDSDNLADLQYALKLARGLQMSKEHKEPIVVELNDLIKKVKGGR